jgi:excisionase family DNA binding protein
MTIGEAATKYRCSKRTIWRYIHNGRLKMQQPGGPGCQVLVEVE